MLSPRNKMPSSTAIGFVCFGAFVLLILPPHFYVVSHSKRTSRKPPEIPKLPEVVVLTKKVGNRAFMDKMFPPVDGTPGYDFLSNHNISYQNNIYLSQYGLHYCKIDKNGGSAMQATMCFLSDTERFFKKYTKKSKWGPGLYSGFKECATETTNGVIRNETLAAANRSDFFENENITHFALIRHPLGRFVSAYLDICHSRKIKHKKADYCYGCDTLDCFLVNNYWYIRKKTEGRPVNKFALDWHFYPQSWYCDFANNLDKYRLLIYDHAKNFVDDFERLLSSHKVDGISADIVRSVLTRKTTSHAANSTIVGEVTRQLTEDKALLRLLYNTYYADFMMFEFSFERE